MRIYITFSFETTLDFPKVPEPYFSQDLPPPPPKKIERPERKRSADRRRRSRSGDRRRSRRDRRRRDSKIQIDINQVYIKNHIDIFAKLKTKFFKSE